jgi:elongation factor P
MKVNANQLRQGQVVDIDGKLYAIIKADNIQPGKGTPVMQLEMRRLSDGVKTVERYRTTESIERAFIDEHEFQYLYQDGDAYTFMDVATYEQIAVPQEIIGEGAVFLQEGMHVSIRLHEGTPVSLEMPSKVTLEVTETDAVVKGQTAASSYKRAILSNGVKTMVPPHIGTGTRIVVNTADSSYIERAKD